MNVFLESTKGFISLVGAGGKKSFMYALSKFVVGRVALSSTTRMYKYNKSIVDKIVDIRSEENFELNHKGRVVAFQKESSKQGRVEGLLEEELDCIWRSKKFEFLVCKADGARAKLIKCPNDDEPIIPTSCDLVVPIVSIKALGEKLTFSDIVDEVAGVYPTIMMDGDMDAGAWSCGMVAGLVYDIPSVKELIDRIMSEAEEIIQSKLKQAV